MGDQLDSMELLLRIRSEGQENLRVTGDLVAKLGQVVNANASLLDDFTKRVQAQTNAVQKFANEATAAFNDMAKRGVEDLARRNKDAVDRQIADNERLVKSYEKRASAAGKSGLERLQQQNAGVLGDFSGSTEQVNRLKTAMGQLEEVQGRQSGFAQRVRAWITYPLYEAGKAAESFLVSLGPVGIGIGAVTVAAGAAAFAIVKLASNVAEAELEFKNFSLRTGLSIQATQQFIGAAQIAGVNAFALESSVRKLSEALADGGVEGKKSADALARVGVQAYTAHGQLRPMDQILPEIFRKLNDVKNPADRATLALELLGRSGRELIPLLGNLDAFMAKSKELGAVIDSEGIKKVDSYGMAVRELGTAWDGLIRKLGVKAVGIIELSGIMGGLQKGIQAASTATGQSVISGLGLTSAAALFPPLLPFLAAAGFVGGGASAKNKPALTIGEGHEVVRPDDPRELAANRARAEAFLAQDPGRREKDLQDKINKLNELLESAKARGVDSIQVEATNPNRTSVSEIGRQRNQALAQLESLKEQKKYAEEILKLEEAVTAAKAKTLFGEQKINEEYEKRKQAIEAQTKLANPSARGGRADQLRLAGQERDFNLQKYRQDVAEATSKQQDQFSILTSGRDARLSRSAGSLQAARDRGADLDPNSSAGIEQAFRDRQRAARESAADTLGVVPGLRKSESAARAKGDLIEAGKIALSIEETITKAGEGLVESLYKSEEERIRSVSALKKREREQEIAANRQIADINVGLQKDAVVRSSQLAQLRATLATGGKGSEAAAAGQARDSRIAEALSLTAVEIQRINAQETGDQKRVALAHAYADITKQTAEADLQYQKEIGELQLKRIEQNREASQKIAGALLTRGGATALLREQAKSFETKVLGNAIEPIVAQISNSAAGAIGGQRDASGNLTGIGNLLRGTFLAPHDEQNIPIKNNTDATSTNTAVMVALTKVMAQMAGVSVPEGLPSSNSSTSLGGGAGAAVTAATTAGGGGGLKTLVAALAGGGVGASLGLEGTELFNRSHTVQSALPKSFTIAGGLAGAGLGAVASKFGLGGLFGSHGFSEKPGGGDSAVAPIVQVGQQQLAVQQQMLNALTSQSGLPINIAGAGGVPLPASVTGAISSMSAITQGVGGFGSNAEGYGLDANGDTIGNPGGGAAASVSKLSSISKTIGSFASLMANPFGDKGGTPGVNGEPGTDNGRISGMGLAAAGADIAVGVLGVQAGIKQGGAKGTLNAISSGLGTAAALDPEPISKTALAIAATGAKLISSFLPDPKAIREQQLTTELQNAKYAKPEPVALSIDSSGKVAGSDYKGRLRVFDATPSVSTVQQAIGYDSLHPYNLLTTSQRRLGQTPMPAPVTVVVSTMDSKSFKDNAHNIADAVRVAMQNSHPLNDTVKKTARPV